MFKVEYGTVNVNKYMLIQCAHSRASVVLPFSVQSVHWHQCIACWAEARVYHFEGFGGELPMRGAAAASVVTALVSRGF